MVVGCGNSKSIGIGYKIEVKDKNGKTVRTIVKNKDPICDGLYGILVALISKNSLSITDPSGTSWTFATVDFTKTNALAPAGDDSYGVVVGNGSGTPSYSDNDLFSKIPNGTSSGQLQYGDSSIYQPAPSGNTLIIGVTRTFTNNSGGDINISEIGLLLSLSGTDPNGNAITEPTLILHDTFTPVTVPNGGSITITYYIRLNPS